MSTTEEAAKLFARMIRETGVTAAEAVQALDIAAPALADAWDATLRELMRTSPQARIRMRRLGITLHNGETT